MNHSEQYLILSLPELINLVTTLNMVIMFVILFFRKQNTFPNKLLAVILLLPAISFICNYFLLSGYIYKFASVIYINQITAFLCAPLIYHYIRMLMGSKEKFYLVLHSVSGLAVIASIYYWIKFSGFSTDMKNSIIADMMDEIYQKHVLVLRGIFFGLLNAYFVHIAILIWQYRKKIMNIKPDYEPLKLKYLQQFVILLWALNFSILAAYNIFPNFYVDFVGVPLIVNIFYFFLIRTGFTNHAIFTREGFSDFKKNISQIKGISLEKVNKKELSNETVEHLKRKIDYLIEEKKIFTDSEINIIKLSEAIEQPVHLTSYFINEFLQTNFYNLINSKRIELAKKKLKQRGKDSEIEIIAFEVGFNSKSAFYRAFSRYVRQSPKDFIRSVE